ncbi:MAG TPA: apolipoprotein N-acyltransferase [Microbacteriaceae bacterium]|nr:apolipoprotein N-acyltransferase [Microbacteriaceae bacterium]
MVTTGFERTRNGEDAGLRRLPPPHPGGFDRVGKRAAARPRPLMPLWMALVMAAAAGPAYSAAFPSPGLWPLVFPALAAMILPLVGRRAGTAALLGFLSGFGFFLVHVPWLTYFLGHVAWYVADVPWVGLSFAEGVYFAAAAPLITLAFRWLPRVWPSRLGRLGFLPVVVAGLWTAREILAGSWPYGGFAWGRAGLSQSQSPLAGLAAWIGISGVSFVLVLLVVFVVQVFLEPDVRLTGRFVLSVAAGALVFAVPAWPVAVDGYTTVAAVQGNGKAAYADHAPAGSVLVSQVNATIPVLDRNVDMVVWPEGGSDLDPMAVPAAAQVLDQISATMQAPIVTGTITKSGGRYFNSSIVWQAGQGEVAQYDKRHPVPFGEYIPDRAFWHAVAPGFVDLLTRQYTPGTRPNVMPVGNIEAGVAICFDIADDGLFADMMQGGAQIILAQTNNADFGHSDENEQQLAIARMRAIEGGRSLVNISTVGRSQIIGPDGRTLDEIPAYKPGALVDAVPLATETTPASIASVEVGFFVSGLGLAGVVAAGFFVAAGRVSRRRAARRAAR